MPPAQSLIADEFAAAERPRATSLYLLGGPGSLLIGYFLAGWLNDRVGWRLTFAVLGAPGLLLALLAWLTLREPRSLQSAIANGGSRAPDIQLGSVARVLWGLPGFRHIVAAYALGSFFASGIMQWQPAFFIRSFHLGTGALGASLALAYGAGGLLGTYAGGALASRYEERGLHSHLKAMAAAVAIFGLVSTAIYLASTAAVALLLIALGAVLLNGINGPLFAAIQTLVPAEMRATAVAILLLCANFVGLGLGPLAAGMLSDALRPSLGGESLRYALLALSPGYMWMALHLALAGRSIGRRTSGRMPLAKGIAQ